MPHFSYETKKKSGYLTERDAPHSFRETQKRKKSVLTSRKLLKQYLEELGKRAELRSAQISLRVAELEREMRDLTAELQAVKAAVFPCPPVRGRQSNADPQIASVIKITHELFSGSEVRIEMETDPEEPEVEFVVIKVSCGGEIEDILEKEMEWNRRVDKADSGYSGQIRLLVTPIE